MKKSCLSLPLLAVLSGVCCGAVNPSATMPLVEKANAPVVDGIIGEAEWRDAVVIAGFLNTRTEPKIAEVGGEGVVRILCDGERLFLAFRFDVKANDPNGGLAVSEKQRDGAVFSDDNIEILLRSASDDGKVFHIVVNSIDTVFDRIWPFAGGGDVRWDCPGLQVRNVVNAQGWSCEISLPLKSIGVEKSGDLSLNAVRNSPGDPSAILIPAKDYRQGEKLRLTWGAGEPAVQLYALGQPQEGHWSPAVRVTGGKEGTKYAVTLALHEMRDVKTVAKSCFDMTKVVAAGETFDGPYNTYSRALHRMTVKVVESPSGRVLLDRTFFSIRAGRSSAIPTTAETLLGTAASCAAYDYPGMNRLRMTVTPEPGRRISAAAIRIGTHMHRLESDGKECFTALVETPAEPYAVDVVLDSDGNRQEFPSAVFIARHSWPWLNAGLGEDRVILPPFAPIMRKGEDGLGVVLRDYALTNEGVPSQITALGRGLLAAPAYFEIVADGKPAERFSGEARAIDVAKDGYEAKVKTRAKTASGIGLASVGAFDYDGFLKSGVSLTGVKGRTVERLTLVIPFKDAEVPLMNICTVDSIRYNSVGALPKGEGTVWDGTKLYRGSEFAPNNRKVEDQCVPYVWLGAERRGLSYCINNTCGFKLAADKPSVRIVRKKEVVRLEIDVINRPVKLAEGHSFEYAIEATPVKPMPTGFERHFQDSCGAPEGFTERMEVRNEDVGLIRCFSHTPNNEDWSAFAAACRRMTEGPSYQDEYVRISNAVWERNLPDIKAYSELRQRVGKQAYWEWRGSMREGNLNLMAKAKAGTFPMKYSDPTLSAIGDEAVETFRSEWISRDTGYDGARRCFLVPSYMDYVLWYHYNETKNGLKGIYMDDMFPMTCRNPDTLMRRDDEGKWHGNLGIFEMRELVRRAAVIQHKAGVTPRLLQVHMTNCLLVPSFAFATSTLTWEDHYGEDVFQKRFSYDYARAESLGTQVGCEPVALMGAYRKLTPESEWKGGKFAFVSRTQQALLLPLGMKIWLRPQNAYCGADFDLVHRVYRVLGKFGFWDADCRFVAAYDDDGAICAAPGVLVGSWRKKNEAMVVFSNLDGQDKVFAPKVDFAKLGLPPDAKPYDAETEISLADGKVYLAGWDFALVKYTAKAEAPKGEPVVFKDDGKGDIAGWWLNTAFQPLGTAEAVAWRGIDGVKLTPKGRDVHLMRQAALVVKKGDRIRITAKVRGTGKWGAGVYQYKSAERLSWRGENFVSKTAASADRALPVSVEVTVEKDDIAAAKPFFYVQKDADVAIYDVCIERE